MKAKVIQFTADWNGVKTVTTDITNITTGVYFFPDHNDYVNLVIEHKGSYVVLDSMPEHRLHILSHEALKDIRDGIEKLILGLSYPNLVHMEFAKEVGMDLETLQKNRDNHIKAVKERQQKMYQERAEREKQAEDQRITDLAGYELALKNGERISYTKVIELMDHKGYYVHPRTKAVMIRHVEEHATIGLNRGCFHSDVKQSTKDSIFKTVRKFIESL